MSFVLHVLEFWCEGSFWGVGSNVFVACIPTLSLLLSLSLFSPLPGVLAAACTKFIKSPQQNQPFAPLWGALLIQSHSQ